MLLGRVFALDSSKLVEHSMNIPEWIYYVFRGELIIGAGTSERAAIADAKFNLKGEKVSNLVVRRADASPERRAELYLFYFVKKIGAEE